EKANALLKLYDQKTRRLSITNAFGDVRVRAGSAVVIALELGDIIVSQYFMAERVTHKFEKEQHVMDLVLVGGEFIA
ncbi:MAG: hydrolase, partial [Butyricicoccus sp.]